MASFNEGLVCLKPSVSAPTIRQDVVSRTDKDSAFCIIRMQVPLWTMRFTTSRKRIDCCISRVLRTPNFRKQISPGTCAPLLNRHIACLCLARRPMIRHAEILLYTWYVKGRSWRSHSFRHSFRTATAYMYRDAYYSVHSGSRRERVSRLRRLLLHPKPGCL